MKSTNLTPSQVASMLDVSSSTLRLWSGQFADHLSPAANPGERRRRSYTADDVSVLQQARDALRSGRTVHEVVVLLSVPQDAPGTALVTQQAMIGELNAARAALASLAAQQTANADAIDKLTNQVANLQVEVETMKRAPWWKRLFNRG